MRKIKALCYEYTNLNDDDILRIEQIAETLQMVSNLVRADVFIDCPTHNPNEAIIVAEAKPVSHPSMYKDFVVGQLALRQNEPAVLRTLELGMPTRDLKAVTQENIAVKQTVEPIKNDNYETIGVLIIEKDITDKLIKNRRLQILAETNEKLTNELQGQNSDTKNITYHIDDAIIVFDDEGVVRFRNPVADQLYEKFGYKENLIGMDFDNIALHKNSFNDIINNKSCEVFEVNIGDFILQIKYIVQYSKIFNLVMLIKDITDMKQKEKELILKSVAIKEIHHRVKNNLQTIASLLRLQSRRIESEEFKSILNESMNRILSIAATHEILAQQGIDDVDIKEVILKIKSSIIRCFTVESIMIDVEVKGEGFSIDSDKSTSIALIINELLQNSLKHAFVGREAGKIEITIEKGNLCSTILVIDNGIGFDVNSVKSNSLGLNIVRSLVKDKLDGNLNICSNDNGTKVLFDFKN